MPVIPVLRKLIQKSWVEFKDNLGYKLNSRPTRVTYQDCLTITRSGIMMGYTCKPNTQRQRQRSGTGGKIGIYIYVCACMCVCMCTCLQKNLYATESYNTENMPIEVQGTNRTLTWLDWTDKLCTEATFHFPLYTDSQSNTQRNSKNDKISLKLFEWHLYCTLN